VPLKWLTLMQMLEVVGADVDGGGEEAITSGLVRVSAMNLLIPANLLIS
jgi:hypothetical protein